MFIDRPKEKRGQAEKTGVQGGESLTAEVKLRSGRTVYEHSTRKGRTGGSFVRIDIGCLGGGGEHANAMRMSTRKAHTQEKTKRPLSQRCFQAEYISWTTESR